MAFRSGVYDLERGVELILRRSDKEAYHVLDLHMRSTLGTRTLSFIADWIGGRGVETEWVVRRNVREKDDRYWSTFEPMIEDALRAWAPNKTPGQIVFARPGRTFREETKYVLGLRPPKTGRGFCKGVYDLERGYELVECKNDFRSATLQLRGKREVLTFALVEEIGQLQVDYPGSGKWAPLIVEALGPWSWRLGREIAFTDAPHEP